MVLVIFPLNVFGTYGNSPNDSSGLSTCLSGIVGIILEFEKINFYAKKHENSPQDQWPFWNIWYIVLLLDYYFQIRIYLHRH